MSGVTYTTNELVAARKARVEALARLICAQKMSLVNDATGEKQDWHMWSRYVSFADALLNLIG